MKLTQILAAAALAVTAALVTAEAHGIALQDVQAKQRYPWNGLVDIDYTVNNDDGTTLDVDDNLEVMLIDHDATPAVTNRAITFLQAPLPLTAGQHRVTWDANADGVTSRIDNAEFVVTLRHYSEAYMVINVSAGSSGNPDYPVDFLNGAPQGGFNTTEYKTGKIVLRRIHPGSYMAGSPEGGEADRNGARETQHRVALSQPFYIGIFEITQGQYFRVTGKSPSKGWTGGTHPVESVSYKTICDEFMGCLLARCKSRDSSGNYTVPVKGFDLPTDFQWEYACRAGTTKAFNTTNDFDNTSNEEQEAQMKLLGRYKGNTPDGEGHVVVGSYLPNAWGLYDMHGNVWEWCRDWSVEDPSTLKQYRDPQGPATAPEGLANSNRRIRGGAYNAGAGGCRSARMHQFFPDSVDTYLGFRLVRTLP